ncbi:translation initiation factor IF-2 [Sediminicoccus sp. KRV36]|uniref:translation initiation factor IF-2 n=1 Tax=Sediminicoccus sp. KRV36 TaxID=3133721 RepID=UPI00200C9BEF|nr:translation initiation factor IF-2 [Sediminicoccus rosea]UPY37674.1 translation initiation factor IF-2 [Sediminicoccus rosea]
MSDQNEQDAAKSRLSLRPAGRLEMGKTVDAGSVRQSFSHGRSKVVQVEVVKKRAPGTGAPTTTLRAPVAPARPGAARPAGGPGQAAAPAPAPGAPRPAPPRPPTAPSGRPLTAAELATRQRVLEEQRRVEAAREREQREQQALMVRSAAEEAARRAEEEARQREEDEAAARAAAGQARQAARDAEAAGASAAPVPAAAAPAAPAAPVDAEAEPARPAAPRVTPLAARAVAGPAVRPSNPPPSGPSAKLSLNPRARGEEEDDRRGPARRPGGGTSPGGVKRPMPAPVKKAPLAIGRREGRIDVAAAMDGEDERSRSMASVRRARERERRQAELVRLRAGQERVVRDVIIPETISVQELANRMAARGGEVVKALFRMGVMATLTQSIDADTAELVAQEFGHRVKRVAEDDVELGLEGMVDEEEALLPRPPVVTIMGHVDHGKTSLLDALRKTDVAAREAGGITQHIGAYQVETAQGRVTFIDTPGHEAFTAMRARGAGVTDMVVLVVAADDGVMPQTIEAIKHARAADVPLIVAVNKIDKPGINLDRVRQELLQHEIVVESLGGETQEIQVSATKGTNLDKLLEAIQLQAEILDLRANPERPGEGTVIESKLDRGRGPVATVLVQKGTLKQGDIVVAGAEWGRARALVDNLGKPVKTAGPSVPVEILGLSGVPSAGENFVVVESETQAREVSEFRQRRARDKVAAALGAGRGTLNDMLARIQAGEQKEVAVVVKADVQGSAEAINVTLGKLGNEEVRIRVLHSAVGQITESDIQLAKASNAVVVAFNVRATSQAREMAQRDGVDIRYYSIIYQVSDDIEAIFKSRLAPVQRESFIGYAQILQVFEVKRLGNVAGCRVTEGVVKRGCGVRLLREGIVIHEGELSTLRRFKDDVKEVINGYECGMGFKNYDDIRVGDQIECFETETVAAA